MGEHELPKSTRICLLETDRYWITPAEWESPFNHAFEIGIRDKTSPDIFFLVTGNWRTALAVEKAAGAVRLMLQDGYTPSEIVNEVFQ